MPRWTLTAARRPWIRVSAGITVAGLALGLVGPAAGATPGTATGTLTAASRPAVPQLGVLEADPRLMGADAQVGIHFATVNLSWAQYEPEPGVFDPGYRSAVEAKVGAYRADKWKVAVDLGLQIPPAWALALPGGQLIDQNGVRSTTADFEYSQAVRTAAGRYIRSVVTSLGPVNKYRIGLSENGETYYPDTWDNGWWAFTAQAQGSARGLPAGVGTTPMPGWVPGTSAWNGTAVTPARVTGWYAWYFGALVNALTWEIDTLRGAGHTGRLELVMPGMGALPAFYQQRLASDLAPGGEDSFSTLNTGAVWWLLLDDLKASTLTNTVIDDSSVDDASGNPQGNVCQPGDSAVPIDSSYIWGWSDTRWLAYLARAHGLPVMGETPGYTTPADLAGQVQLAYACHLTYLQWAWDYTLDQPGSVSRVQLAAAVADDS